MFNNGGQIPAYGNEKTLFQVNLEKKLRKIILENEGDRDDIYSDVLNLVNPLIEALSEILEPSGAYSKDALTHANNVIKNSSAIAREVLDSIAPNTPPL